MNNFDPFLTDLNQLKLIRMPLSGLERRYMSLCRLVGQFIHQSVYTVSFSAYLEYFNVLIIFANYFAGEHPTKRI